SHHGAEFSAPRQPKKGFAIIWYSSASTKRAGARTSASSDSSVLDIWTSTPLRPRPAVDNPAETCTIIGRSRPAARPAVHLAPNENLPMDDPFAVAVRTALCMVGPTGLVVILY